MRGQDRHHQRLIEHRADRGAIDRMFGKLRRDMRHIGAGFHRNPLPVLGKIGEHREQHEAAHEIERFIERQRIEPLIDRVGPGDAAMPVHRRRTDIFGPPVQRVAAQFTDHIAKDATKEADVGVLRDRCR